MTTATAPRKDWVNIIFLALTPLMAGPVLITYSIYNGVSLWMPVLFLIMYSLVGLSICAGYHRYFSHKSYECHPIIQVFYAVFGAMAAQNTILRWSSEHRRHHAHTESDWDPYSISRGFWWAHIVWIFYDTASADGYSNVRDLQKNPIVNFQERWCKVLLVVAGFGLPTLIGAFFGDPIAGLLWGGFLRVVVVHHSTFFVNSLAHTFGSRTYDADATARDNWFVALLTLGEGYHSFHHRFPSDFRNGVRWYNWDPAKWFIGFLSFVGLAGKLRTMSKPVIEHARMHVLIKQIEEKMQNTSPTLQSRIQEQILRVREALDKELIAWNAMTKARRDGLSDAWKEARTAYRDSLKQAQLEWRSLMECKQLDV